jgi:predicted nuclease of predicted toxin-antitoxin system
VRPLEYPLLLDENIHPAVASGLVALGCDVVTVASRDAAGATDEEVLAIANAEGRVVVTHDSDFGTLTVRW